MNSTIWNPVLQKIKNKVQSWGMRWLSLVGSAILIKSVLSSYPIFTSAMFLAPKAVMNNINIEIRKFLWEGGKTQSKKFHLVNSTTIKDAKSKGGLGLRDPRRMNIAMGAKLV